MRMTRSDSKGDGTRGRGNPQKILTTQQALERAREKPGIVYSYVAAVLSQTGETSVAYALQCLWNEYGTRITHSQIAMWRLGTRSIPPAALRAMLQRALPWILSEVGVDAARCTKEQLTALAELLVTSVESKPDVVEWLTMTVLGKAAVKMDRKRMPWLVAAVRPPPLNKVKTWAR